jgi:hypothetical protein
VGLKLLILVHQELENYIYKDKVVKAFKILWFVTISGVKKNRAIYLNKLEKNNYNNQDNCVLFHKFYEEVFKNYNPFMNEL